MATTNSNDIEQELLPPPPPSPIFRHYMPSDSITPSANVRRGRGRPKGSKKQHQSALPTSTAEASADDQERTASTRRPRGRPPGAAKRTAEDSGEQRPAKRARGRPTRAPSPAVQIEWRNEVRDNPFYFVSLLTVC